MATKIIMPKLGMAMRDGKLVQWLKGGGAEVKKDEPVERALRRFKRLCERAGITKTVRAKRYYEKPSDVRRREVRKSLRNRRRAERKAKERMQR